MKDPVFHFKYFSCRHAISSMKIGVDGVLLGAWANVSGSSILDVGTGCGVISLMCAQRNTTATIYAIDKDENSIKEAIINFQKSPWSERLEATLEDFMHNNLNNLDLIISNPPFFNSGIKKPSTPREVARHQSSLSPAVILDKGSNMLNDNGRISMILPFDQSDEIRLHAESLGLKLIRANYVKDHASSKPKRSLMEFAYSGEPVKSIETLVLHSADGAPSPEYKNLCKDFYLKF